MAVVPFESEHTGVEPACRGKGAGGATSWIACLAHSIADRVWRQSSTFRRLIFSRHVLDLQVIFVGTLLATALMLWWGWHIRSIVPASLPGTGTTPVEIDKQFVGAVLLICGTILAWVYQTGSKRLGVVDLFACEIVTLCRVGTIMDVVPQLKRAYEGLRGPSTSGTQLDASHQNFAFGRFTSEEDYFPVFEQNNRDLQILEADVVINVTAFYTYMKAFRDQLRSLGELGSEASSNGRKCVVLVNAIYMLFLGYESARKSIQELMEYEPAQAEATVTCLVTEVAAYRFLTKCFDPDDIRGRRLSLREKEYSELVPQLYDTVMKMTGPEWGNAQTTAVDLERLYNSSDFAEKIAAKTVLSPDKPMM
jgi:hypothetical protein